MIWYQMPADFIRLDENPRPSKLGTGHPRVFLMLTGWAGHPPTATTKANSKTFHEW
jgi:hypothetical protein